MRLKTFVNLMSLFLVTHYGGSKYCVNFLDFDTDMLISIFPDLLVLRFAWYILLVLQKGRGEFFLIVFFLVLHKCRLKYKLKVYLSEFVCIMGVK